MKPIYLHVLLQEEDGDSWKEFLLSSKKDPKSAHVLVDRPLGLLALGHRHQVARLRADPLPHPIPHPGAAHGRDGTFGDRHDERLYLLQLGSGVDLRGLGQRHVHQHAVVVDAFVDVVVGQLGVGQLPHPLRDRPHRADVTLAVLDQRGHQGGVVVERAVGARDAQRAHQLAAIMGTAIHSAIEEAITVVDPKSEKYWVETSVEYNGMKAHIDLYIPETGDVIDWKTVKVKNLSYFPSLQQRWQVQVY